MRRNDILHPFHGVAGFGPAADSLRERVAAYAPLLRDGQVLSHTTALALWGAPLPAWAERASEPLHLSVLFPRTPPRGAGVQGHALRRLVHLERDNLPLADPAYAWCQAAAQLSREDLVAAGDALVTGRRVRGVRQPGVTTIAHLGEVVALMQGSPGAARMAWALARVRAGVDSAGETRLRLGCVRYRLGEPSVDYGILVAGRVLLHADLAFVAERICLEYEGDHHRIDRATWMADLQRRELLEAAGWRVVRVTAHDLEVAPDAFFARLRRLRAERAPAK